MTGSEVDRAASGASRTATIPRVAGAGQLAMRARVPSPALQGLLALAAYLAVFIIFYAYPLVRHPGLPQIGQNQVDPNFYIWSWRWVPYALSHGLNPLFSRQIGAPGGYDLAWTTPAPAVAVVVAPLTALFGPIVSFNLTMLLAAPVSAWAAFLAARRLTGRFWAALMAGTVYGFSPYEVGHTGAGQANLAVIMLLPILVYLALLWRDGKLGRPAFVGLTAAAMAAEFYIFDEAFAELTVLGAVGLLIGFALARPADRPKVASLARLVALAWAVAIVLASPYLIYALEHYPAKQITRSLPGNSLNLKALVIPESGIPLLLMVLALAVLAWSRRLTRLLVIMFALIVVLALGPHLFLSGTTQLGSLPWGRLWKLPLARSAEPVRLMLFGYLVLALIVALWLALRAKNKLLLAAQWILGLAAVAAIVAYIPKASTWKVLPVGTPFQAQPTNPLPAFISAGLYRHYLRPGEIVVVVSDRGNAGMLFQADTNFYFRIAGGFINATFSNLSALPEPVANLDHWEPGPEQKFRVYVRQARVGAILVEYSWAPPWARVFGRPAGAALSQGGLGLHGTLVGGVWVYPITQPPR